MSYRLPIGSPIGSLQVERAMALLFLVLTPAPLASSDSERTAEAEEQHLAAKLHWKDDLRSMLGPKQYLLSDCSVVVFRYLDFWTCGDCSRVHFKIFISTF